MGIFDFLGNKKGDERGRDDSAGRLAKHRKQGRSLEEHGTQLDEAIRIIRKHPYMKYTFDDELLSALEKSQQEILFTQQMILDSVTVKDPKKGDVGLAEYLTSGSLLEQVKVASVPAGKEDNEGRQALETLIGKLNQKIDLLESDLEEERQNNLALSTGITEIKGAHEKELSKKEVDRKMAKINKALGKMKPPKSVKAPEVHVPELPVAQAAQARPKMPAAKEGGISKFMHGLSSAIGASKFLQRQDKYQPFTEGNFYFEYPDWVPDLNVSEDVILSVSSGACGVEASVKKLYPLTFGGYVTKITSLVKTQLKATILEEKTGVDTAYVEFTFRQGNLTWLYKAKIVECDSMFYTVAVKLLKEDEQKLAALSEHVLNSVRCVR